MIAAWTKRRDRLAIGWANLKRVAILVDRNAFRRNIVATVAAANAIAFA